MVTARPDRDEWHLRGALWLAEMGDCTRRQVGALIVGPDKRFWGMGYNGGRPGGPSCLKGDCPRGRHYPVSVDCEVTDHFDLDDPLDHHCPPDVCACDGGSWPCPDAVAPGSSYDTGPGACVSSHAEDNAVDDAKTKGHGRMPGGIMYVTCAPCEGCIRLVRNKTDIEAIIWPDGVIGLP